MEIFEVTWSCGIDSEFFSTRVTNKVAPAHICLKWEHSVVVQPQSVGAVVGTTEAVCGVSMNNHSPDAGRVVNNHRILSPRRCSAL
jgi:hypothetical protein